MAGYIYKPQTRKGPVFIAPNDAGRAPTITGADGRVFTARRGDQAGGVFYGHEGYQWVFDNDVTGLKGAKLSYGDQSQDIANGAMSYRGGSLGSLEESSKGALGSYEGIGGGPNINGFGVSPADMSGFYPDPVLAVFDSIKKAKYKETDVMDFAKRYGEFNREEIQKNFDIASKYASNTLNQELQSLESYVPAAAALKRSQTSIDNIFNQSERTAQINAGLPGVVADLEEQAGRARDYAEGRVPDDVLNQALELGIRSDSADRSAAGGFGTRSSVARKASDLMSAERRIALSQYGDSLLSSNITQKANLLLAPTQYSNAGAQINVNPPVSYSQLANSYLGDLNASTTVSATNALQTTIGQEQYKTNLAQRTNEFNANGNFQESQVNASIKNAFATGLFDYRVGLASAEAGAAASNIRTELDLAEQEKAREATDSAASAARRSQTVADIAGGLAAIGTVAGSFSGSNGASGGGGSGGGGDVGTNPNGTYGGYSGPQGYAETPSYGGYSGPVMDNGVPVSGYTPGSFDAAHDAGYAGGSGAGGGGFGGGESLGSDFTSATGIEPNSVSNGAIVRSSAALGTAGISYQPGNEMAPIGVDNSGRQVYGSIPLMQSPDTSMGESLVNTVKSTLDPMGVFSNEESSAMDKIAVAAGDASLIAQLTAQHVAGDTEGFVSTLVNTFGRNAVKANADSPEAKAGVDAAVTAYQLSQNWDRMSGAQKSMGLAALGMQTYRSATGKSLAEQAIVKPVLDDVGKVVQPGLSVGQGMALFSAGYNTYSLVKNWNQLNTLQKVAAGSGNAAQIAQLAKQFNLLGSGTTGAAVQVTEQQLAAQGFQAAPELGIGAIEGAAGSQVPEGYSVIAQTADKVTAVPTANAASAEGANTVATEALGQAAGAASVALGAKQVYAGWGQGGKSGQINGAIGGSAIAAGLYSMGATNPYVLAGVVAASYLANGIKMSPRTAAGTKDAISASTFGSGEFLDEGNTQNQKAAKGAAYAIPGVGPLIAGADAVFGSDYWKSGKSAEQGARDSVRDTLGKLGVANEFKLPDGTTADIGIDGRGGKHSITDPSRLVGDAKPKDLNSYDTDYTNDMDYASGMAGIALGRLVVGGIHTAGDQVGSQLGNAMLGSVGYGKPMTAENYKTVMQNARATYAQAGIKSKADAYQLANQGYAEGRFSESDTVAIHQAINMVFDDKGSYETAQKLMAGRFRGVEVAHENSKATKNVSNVAEPVQVKTPLETVRGKPTRNIDPGFVMPKSRVPSKSSLHMTKEDIKRRNRERFSVGAVA